MRSRFLIGTAILVGVSAVIGCAATGQEQPRQRIRRVEKKSAHCDLHSARPGGASVELCVTETGGHSWPGGGTQRGRKQPSTAIRANDLMRNFFSSL